MHPDKTASESLALRTQAEGAFTLLGEVWSAVCDAKSGSLLEPTTSAEV